MKKKSILFALSCCVLAVAAGCAAPGAPQPPSLRLPVPVDNLSAVRKGNRVVLTWSPPTETTDHQTIRWATTTRICRVVNQFPVNTCGEVVKEIKAGELASAAPDARRPVVSFEDVLPPAILNIQNQATYAVEVINERGRSAGLSNQVRTSLAPTLPPLSAFRATLDSQGPLLEWNASSAGVPGSYRVRIYRRIRGKNDFAMVEEVPLRAGHDEARDGSFEWEQEYDYKAAVVTVVNSGRTLMELEGDDSDVVHLSAHDIFPPAVPMGLQAVFSSVGQKPFIDLTWAPDTDSDLAGYVVFRRTSGTAFAPVSAAPVQAPAWRDNHVMPGQTYYYTVAAIDQRGNQSAQSVPAEESVPQEVR